MNPDNQPPKSIENHADHGEIADNQIGIAGCKHKPLGNLPCGFALSRSQSGIYLSNPSKELLPPFVFFSKMAHMAGSDNESQLIEPDLRSRAINSGHRRSCD